MSTPFEVVQRQFDAYNARDLALFLANFSDSFRGYRKPGSAPTLVGKAQLADFYATQRFNRPGLKAELIHRQVMGNKVFDFERIWGVGDGPVEMAAVFDVRDGLIEASWMFPVD